MFNNGYFNYTLCFGKNVTQSRSVNGKKVTETVLAAKLAERKYMKNMIKEHYIDGNMCLDNGKRNVNVQFKCLHNNIYLPTLVGMNEVNCTYTFDLQIPELCAHQHFHDLHLPTRIKCCAKSKK